MILALLILALPAQADDMEQVAQETSQTVDELTVLLFFLADKQAIDEKTAPEGWVQPTWEIYLAQEPLRSCLPTAEVPEPCLAVATPPAVAEQPPANAPAPIEAAVEAIKKK